MLVTTDEKTAKDYAMERHKKLVRKYKGLARTAISLAMKAIYNKGAAVDNVSNEAAQTAKEVTQVKVNDTGFNSGTASVYVHDGLNYAVSAMKDGESSVTQAVNAALRRSRLKRKMVLQLADPERSGTASENFRKTERPSIASRTKTRKRSRPSTRQKSVTPRISAKKSKRQRLNLRNSERNTKKTRLNCNNFVNSILPT